MASEKCLWWLSLVFAGFLTVWGALLAVWYYIDLEPLKEEEVTVTEFDWHNVTTLEPLGIHTIPSYPWFPTISTPIAWLPIPTSDAWAPTTTVPWFMVPTSDAWAPTTTVPWFMVPTSDAWAPTTTVPWFMVPTSDAWAPTTTTVPWFMAPASNAWPIVTSTISWLTVPEWLTIPTSIPTPTPSLSWIPTTEGIPPEPTSAAGADTLSLSIPGVINITIPRPVWLPREGLRYASDNRGLSSGRTASSPAEQNPEKNYEDEEEIAEGGETLTFILKTEVIYFDPKKEEDGLTTEAPQWTSRQELVPLPTYLPTTEQVGLVTEAPQRSSGHERVLLRKYFHPKKQDNAPRQSSGPKSLPVGTDRPTTQPTEKVTEEPQRISGHEHVPTRRLRPKPRKPGLFPVTREHEPRTTHEQDRPPPRVKEKESKEDGEQRDDVWYWEDTTEEPKTTTVCLPQGDRFLVFGMTYMVLGPLLFVAVYEKVPWTIYFFLWTFTSTAMVHTVVAIVSAANELDCGGVFEIVLAIAFLLIAIIIVMVVVKYYQVAEKQFIQDQERLRRENVDIL